MFDFERFDQFVAVHDNDVESHELSTVAIKFVVLIEALFGHTAALAVASDVVQTGLKGAFGDADGFEAQAHLDLGDGVSALEELFDEVDLLNFKFGQDSQALKCYAMTGMLENEQPAASYNDKLNGLGELLAWGSMICAIIPLEQADLAAFRSIVMAAEARFSLDLDHPVDANQFAHLAALFRDGSPDQVRKTIQNQISAKQLAVDDSRKIMPESALNFLKGVPGFPSIWMLPDCADEPQTKVSAPIFIPVGRSLFIAAETPFLPSQRHTDGYHIGAGGQSEIVTDYWQALAKLETLSEPSFTPVGLAHPVKCKEEWLRVDQSLIQNELEAIEQDPASTSVSLTEQAHRRLMSNPKIQTHSAGHSKKVYRYRTTPGIELALEKRIGEPWLLMLEKLAPSIEGVTAESVGADNIGRNSNLGSLPTFSGQPLTKFRITRVADLEAVLLALDL